MFWNGYAGEINFLLSKNVNIINNSWGYEDERGYANYDYNAEYFDNMINSNPELINIKSAGNQFDGDSKDNGEYIPPYKYIAASSLSKNSIVVGAINTNQDQNKTTYSQISGNGNYVSVVAPGNKYSFSKNPKELWNETSYSAPVISALASMILQRNKNQFARGHDSIIMKSALISGSKKPNYTNRVYTEETGFGIPQFLDVDQAVKNLYYFAQLRKASNDWNKYKVYFKRGEKVRANITWLAHNVKSNGFADIDLYVYDQNGNQVAYSNGVDKNTETVEFNVETSGQYTFHVKRYSDDEKDYRKLVDVALTYVRK